MNVFYGLNNLPQFVHAVITIGTFDGVHKGHQVILQNIVKKAKETQGESVIITFEPHPRFVISPNQKNIFLLNTLDEKIENLKKQDIDNLVIVNFTKEFANMEADEYIKNFLIEKFHPHTIIIGFDHQFGRNRHGNFKMLEDYKNQYHFCLEEIPMQVIEENKISSTKIREAILIGDVEKAKRYLGENYTIEGRVVEGEKRGRQIGYPTANIEIQNPYKLLPAKGVYAVRVCIDSKHFDGMMNIGNNPTFVDTNKLFLEVNIFNFDEDIYGKIIKVFFVKRIRDEKKFLSVNELILAIDEDKRQSLEVLNLNK